MRVLALITEPPFPPVSGTRVRNYHLWPALAALGHEVKVVGIDPLGRGGEPPTTWAGLEGRFFRPRREALPFRAFKGLTRSYHEFPRVHALADEVDRLVETWRPDVVHAEELRMAYYLPGYRGRAPRGGAVESVAFHNVESDLFPQIAAPTVAVGRSFFKGLQVRSLRRFERRVVGSTGVRFAYSDADRARYQAIYPGVAFEATRNGTDAWGLSPAAGPATRSILMVASWVYAPNRSGLEWFIDEVWPMLATGATLTVAGSGFDDGLKVRLAGLGARVVDTPLELKPLYDAHALVVVPLFVGSGTRGKILEALAHGRMVVTTPKGPEGLDLAEGEGYDLARDATAMARAVDEALGSREAREACALRGREAVLVRYDWSVVANGLKDVWQRCVSR